MSWRSREKEKRFRLFFFFFFIYLFYSCTRSSLLMCISFQLFFLLIFCSRSCLAFYFFSPMHIAIFEGRSIVNARRNFYFSSLFLDLHYSIASSGTAALPAAIFTNGNLFSKAAESLIFNQIFSSRVAGNLLSPWDPVRHTLTCSKCGISEKMKFTIKCYV